ncbi:hypothetical protein BDV12DRAFT_44019 [Aspergillus spectabilis]
MRSKRWMAVAEFPITKTLSKCLTPKTSPALQKSHIVSEKLCDDILQRLSPYLLRNAPVDIIDLWPGPGVLSSKVNDLLKPRRHVLIEPNLNAFKALLEPLAQSHPSYKLASLDLNAVRDWQSLLSEHFPEQGPSNSDNSGALPRNDTLLVLAHPPPGVSTKDHFSGARFLSQFIAGCIRQYGLHAYGSVRLLASMSSQDRLSIFPRTIHNRVRPSLLMESIPLHAFEVAAAEDDTRGQWGPLKQWDTIMGSATRAAERTSEKNVVIPAGREQPPPEPAPEAPEPGRKPAPYTPRMKTTQNEKYLELFDAFDKATPKSKGYAELKKKRDRALIQLNQENRQTHHRSVLVSRQAEIDELHRSISRLAAEEKTTLVELKRIVKRIDDRRKALEKETADVHFDTTRALPHLIDDRRAAFYTGSYDDSVLLWDRRPFEPLLIHPNELFPLENPRILLYLEANPNAPSMRRMQDLTPAQQVAAIHLFDAFTHTLTTNNVVPVSRFLELIFPNRSANDIVKAVPLLAKYASKRPKASFNSLPKTLHYHPADLPTPDSKPDPICSYQENLNYNFASVHTRILSSDALWAVAVEYAREGGDGSIIQLTRLLGGTVTGALTRDFIDEPKKIR